MGDLMTRWGACIVLCGLGLFFIIMTVWADRAGRSGVPFTGALCIALGFLLSPVKWLAVLALLDPGVPGVVFAIVENKRFEGARQEFRETLAERGAVPGETDRSRTLVLTIPQREERLEYSWSPGALNMLRVPKVYFGIFGDGEGRTWLMTRGYEEPEEPQLLPLEGETTLTVAQKGKTYTLVFRAEKSR